MADWHTPATLRLQWAAAPSSDPLTQELLDVAQSQVLQRGTLEYVVDPEVEGDQIPVQYRMGQMMYARSLWESQHANIRGEADAIGGDYQVRVYPMSSTILDLISPKIVRVG